MLLRAGGTLDRLRVDGRQIRDSSNCGGLQAGRDELRRPEHVRVPAPNSEHIGQVPRQNRLIVSKRQAFQL